MCVNLPLAAIHAYGPSRGRTVYHSSPIVLVGVLTGVEKG